MALTEPIPFTPEMDWTEPLQETYEFESVVTTFTDGSEQREALMDVAHRRLAYLISALDEQEAGLAEALLYSGQHQRFWVPYWRSASWLGTARSIGQTTLTIDTVRKGYEIGQGVMFLSSPTIVEVATLSNVTDTAITFSALTKNWAASGRTRARVVPCYEGLVSPTVDIDYIRKDASQLRVAFDLYPNAD